MEELFQSVWDVFKNRASVRSFAEKEVSEESIDFLLRCAETAPSSGNMQPAEFIIIRNDQMKQRIVECTFIGYFSKGGEHQSWIREAPVVIVACANQKRTKARYGETGKEWSIIDTSAAVENLIVAASGVGLASCWVGGFNEVKLKEHLSIPSFVKPIGVIPIGHPKGNVERKSRLRQEIIRHNEQYHND